MAGSQSGDSHFQNHNLEAQRLSRLVCEKTLGRTTVAPDTV